MANRTVAVGDDLTLPPSIKVGAVNLPATYVPMDGTGKVGIGGAADATAPFKVYGRAIVGAGTEAGDAVNKGQIDGAALRYSPAGALSVTMDRRLITGTVVPALTSGTLRLTAVWLPKGATVTNVTYLCGTAATALTNRWFSLFDASRVLLRATADNTATWNAGSALTIPLASTYSVPADGLYYVGICEVATTPTALRGVASSTGAGIAIAPILNGDSSTALTNAASTPATAATITASGNLPFAYVT